VIAGETVHVFRENISLECVNVVLVAVLGGGGGGGKGQLVEKRSMEEAINDKPYFCIVCHLYNLVLP
tara:strand:- start:17 stop:217 length:201 start_codon:yes stop_codon:yes gene_type:complete